RDAARGPERLPTLGDPAALGAFELPEPTCDRGNLGAAVADPKARQRPAEAAELARRCILGRVLLARGDVLGVRELASGVALRVRCPNARNHARFGSSGSRDESAILLPHEGLGTIRCMRTACNGLGRDDWLSFFDDHELESA